MPDRVSFGIGCFHFGVKGTLPFSFRGSEYIAEIRRVLESLPSIDGIQIHADKDFEDSIVQVTTELPRLRAVTGCFPRGAFVDLSFQIYLPQRVQEELVADIPWVTPPTERYRVTILYGFEMPVAFVESIGEIIGKIPSQDPSDGVVVVREFMTNAVSDDTSEHVFFDWMGPTPFHADCFLAASTTDEDPADTWTFKLHRDPSSGFDRLMFECSPTRSGHLDTARFHLFSKLLPEISVFYYILCRDQNRTLEWAEIAVALDDLISLQQLRGPKGHLKRVLSSSRDATELLLRVARFEGDMVLARSAIRGKRDHLYTGRSDDFMRSYVDRAIRELGSYPTEQVSRSLDLIHSARVKSVDNMMLLGAALLSGAAGALLIHWLSR